MLDSSEEVDTHLEEEDRLENCIFISQDECSSNFDDGISKESLNHVGDKLTEPDSNIIGSETIESRKRPLSADIFSTSSKESIKRNRLSYDDLLKSECNSSVVHVNGITDDSEENIKSPEKNDDKNSSDLNINQKSLENGEIEHNALDSVNSSDQLCDNVKESESLTKPVSIDDTGVGIKHLNELNCILKSSIGDTIRSNFLSLTDELKSFRKFVLQSRSESDSLKKQLLLLQSSCHAVETKINTKDNLKDSAVQTTKIEENTNERKNSLPLPKDYENNSGGRQPTSQAPKGPPPHYTPKNTQSGNSSSNSLHNDVKAGNVAAGDVIDLTDEEERVPAGTIPKSLPGSLSNGNATTQCHMAKPNGYSRIQPAPYSAPVRYQNQASTNMRSLPSRPPPLPPIPFDGRQLLKSSINPPILSFTKVHDGVSLQWDSAGPSMSRDVVTEYEVYSYSCGERSNQSLTQQQWKKIGQVQALPLPMACTLTQVEQSSTYFFAVRSLDSHSRYSEFSNIIQTN